MSFHLNRLSNKLFKTKLPTSTYQSHYSFKHKRSAKDETQVPQVQVDPDAVFPHPPFTPHIKYSNWRRMSNLQKYEYPEQSAFWVKLSTLLLIPGVIYFESVKKPEKDIISAQANYAWGVADYQNSLDFKYEDS